jgi:hypothetical protein
MSLSRIEAQKIKDFEYNRNVEKDWIYYMGLIDFIDLMDVWKLNPPKKEVLEDFKECINYKHEEYACLGKSIIDRKEIDKEDKVRAVKNLIHFGASKIHMVVATQGTDFSVLIEEYVKDLIGAASFLSASKILKLHYPFKKYELWIWLIKIEDYEDILNILKFWNKNTPSKNVLKDFKKIIELSNYMEDLCYFLSIEEGDQNENDKVYKILNLASKFGGVITEKCIKFFEKESFIEKMRKKLIHDRAGQIIARNIKIAMDDEFHLTELRKRIELRRFKDLISEKSEI